MPSPPLMYTPPEREPGQLYNAGKPAVHAVVPIGRLAPALLLFPVASALSRPGCLWAST